MDWTASGILNRFEYQLVDARDIDSSKGRLEGVTGGKITESWRGEYRSSATLDVEGQIPLGTAVRIWHVAELDGEAVREELGTFWPEPDRLAYEKGRYSGSVSMHSAMKRLGTDLRYDTGTVPKGADPVDKFKKYATTSGAVVRVADSIPKGKELAKAHTWSHGESVLKECQRLADAVGGWIGVDAHGRVVLQPYVSPSRRAVSYTLPTGSSSITLMGLGVSVPKMYNRFIAAYERSYKVKEPNGTYKSDVKYTEDVKDKSGRVIHHKGDVKHAKGSTKYKTKTMKKWFYDKEDVAASHPWSFSKIKRYIVYKCSTPTFSVGQDEEVTEAMVRAELRQLVTRAKAEHSDVRRDFSADILYTPKVKCGDVVRFTYDDGDGSGLSIKAFVSQREIALDGAMRTSLTLEEL